MIHILKETHLGCQKSLCGLRRFEPDYHYEPGYYFVPLERAAEIHANTGDEVCPKCCQAAMLSGMDCPIQYQLSNHDVHEARVPLWTILAIWFFVVLFWTIVIGAFIGLVGCASHTPGATSDLFPDCSGEDTSENIRTR